MILRISEGMTSPMYLRQYSQSGSRRGWKTRQTCGPNSPSMTKESSSFLTICQPTCRGLVSVMRFRRLSSVAPVSLRWWVVELILTATYFSFDQRHLRWVSEYNLSIYL